MTREELQALREGVEYVRALVVAMHEGAEDRALEAEEQTAFDAGCAYIETNESLIARYDAAERVSRRPGHHEPGDAPGLMERVEIFDGTEVAGMRPLEARDRALKLLEDREHVRHLDDAQIDRVDALLRTRTGNSDGAVIARRLLVTEDPAYRSAFQKVSTQSHPILTAEEGRAMQAWEEYRAMSEGTTTAGGFGIPVLIDPTIILTAQGHPNDFFAISRVETITTNAWKGVSSAGVSWSFDAESSEVSDDSPTLAQPTVSVKSARGFIPYSIEVAQDYPGFAAEMARLLASGYSELLVAKFTLGTGTLEPFGIVTTLDVGATSEVVVTTNGAFGAVDVYNLWASLPIRFRGNARWMSHTDVQNAIRSFGTEPGDQFTVNLTQAAITQMFGRDYHLNDYMDQFTGTTGAANLLIVGDWSNFLIAQRAGMTVELVPHLFATANNLPSGQRGWFAQARVGSDVVAKEGFRILQNT